MSLYDCEFCWDYPCTCGYQYIGRLKDTPIRLVGKLARFKLAYRDIWKLASNENYYIRAEARKDVYEAWTHFISKKK